MARRAARLAVLAVLLLTGCKEKPRAPVLSAPAPMATALRAAPGQTEPRIAVTQNFSVVLPNDQVQARQQRDLADCQAAGCMVLSNRINRYANGEIRAFISVRIAPDKYQSFAGQIVAAPAHLLSHSETADDRTTAFLDVEKRLQYQTALRDRLTQLLQQANGSIGDLVAVEKQLADVQATIESETAQRNYLQTITDTVRVDVNYQGLIQQAGPFDLSPVRLAVDGFARGVIVSFGSLISAIAYSIPWLPVAAIALLILRWLFRRRPR